MLPRYASVGKSMNDHKLAIRLMVLQSVLFSAETALIHFLGGRVPIPYLAGIRGAAGIGIAVLVVRSIYLFKSDKIGIQLVRGLAGLVYSWVQVYSFTNLPLADATGISYTQAFYITLFSALLLKEQVSGFRWFSTGLAIVGAVLIAKPSFGTWNSVYLIALIGTSLNGLTFALSRYLLRYDHECTCMAYMNGVILLGNIPLIFFVNPPPMDTTSWLIIYLLLGPIGMYAGLIAAKYADASFLAPYTLLRLIISVVLAMLLFYEFPDATKIVGILLILTGCLFNSVKLPTARKSS
jgi:drug/metabolite transporter (DMT)-like permease